MARKAYSLVNVSIAVQGTPYIRVFIDKCLLRQEPESNINPGAAGCSQKKLPSPGQLADRDGAPVQRQRTTAPSTRVTSPAIPGGEVMLSALNETAAHEYRGHRPGRRPADSHLQATTRSQKSGAKQTGPDVRIRPTDWWRRASVSSTRSPYPAGPSVRGGACAWMSGRAASRGRSGTAEPAAIGEQ